MPGEIIGITGYSRTSYSQAISSSGNWPVIVTAGDGIKASGVQFIEGSTLGIFFSPIYRETITLDTVGPKTVAPYKLACKKGGYVTVSYQVDDTCSPTATVSLQARNAKGKTLKTVALGAQDTGKLVTYLWQPGLAKGTYKYAILATDLAGNKASKVGTNALTVK